MKRILLPWIPVALGLVWVISAVRPPKSPEHELQIHEFAKIPVAFNGRVKPVDTYARNMLRVVSEADTYTDADGKRQPAVRWLLDVMTEYGSRDAAARKHQVFRIVHEQARHELGLEKRHRYRYAIEEFGDKLENLQDGFRDANERNEKDLPLSAYDKQVLSLQRSLNAYIGISRMRMPHVVPLDDEGKEWETFADAVRRGVQDSDPWARSWYAILNAYAEAVAETDKAEREKKVAAFNEGVAAHLKMYADRIPAERKRTGFESVFNNMDPFFICKALYILGFLMSVGAWIIWSGPLRRSSLGLLWFTFALHTFALIARMYLSGRPPVTNLYSSAIFIGWGCVAIGLILEHIYRIGVGNVLAAADGFATLLIAYALSADGDTLQVLQAVLDTQFWLATHVTCITLGYSTSYMAGTIGILFILRGLLTGTLTEEVRRNLARMMYGIICFATFFSFVGTVLGGLWADDSWGRFWGWDPKENGALMIVLWNAIILHARWGGMIRERGLAMLCVFGNIVVTWSWFGVNQLSVGLHSYGFTEGTTFTIIVVVAFHLLILMLGAISEKAWLSPPPERGANAKGR